MRRPSSSISAALLLSTGIINALEVDVTNTDSALAASATIVNDILRIYNNGSGPSIPGLLPSPYYWWESALMFDSLINYWSYTSDNGIVQTIQDGLLFQMGDDMNYMPANQTKSEGNNDQAWWALAAMTAAEQGFPMRDGTNVTWAQLAENVFNTQAARWDTETCGGGIRWQIFSFNNGYNFKLSQGTFVSLAARLARYTGNQTYTDWAQKTIDWTKQVGLYDDGHVYSGTSTATNCSMLNHVQWSMDAGLFLDAGAYMLNITQGSTQNAKQTSDWNDLVLTVFNASSRVFTSSNSSAKNVIVESACQPQDNCDVDQLAFKSVLVRALQNFQALTVSSLTSSGGLSPSSLYSQASAILQASAEGAAAQCSGGQNHTACGFDWTSKQYDGTTGMGQEIDALQAMLANLPPKALKTANSSNATTSSGSNSNSNSPSSSSFASSTGSSTTQSSSPSKSGAARLWSSSALVALCGATFISVLRLSM